MILSLKHNMVVDNLTNEDIFRALLSDSVDIMAGMVVPIPFPRELIRVIYERMRQSPVNKFINTDHGELLRYYDDNTIRYLELTFNNETEYLPQHLVIDNTIEQLSAEHFIFKFDSAVFELPEQFKDKTGHAFNTIVKNITYNNGENLRLSKLEKQNDTYIFHTQPVYYETYLHTNIVVDYEPKNKRTVRSIVHPEGKLERFDESQLANHIGINILIFTPQGHLIIPVRSRKVSYAPLELAASISGAVTATDVSDGRPIQEHAIVREGIEELGLKRNEIIEDSITFLGLTRELVRGGKPEIFFTMETVLSYDEIVTRWKRAEDKWESNKLIYFPFGVNITEPLSTEEDCATFERTIATIFKEYGSNMSLPLITNLALWMKMKRAGK